MSAGNWRIFYFGRIYVRPFFISHKSGNKYMQLTLIRNTDESKSVFYKIARVVYAETCASSLNAVEALTSMIKNRADKMNLDITDVISDTNLFSSLNTSSPRNQFLSVTVNNPKFQMCLRVVTRMMHGMLADCCYGATCFHHDDEIPAWATSRGYIADIDGLLFYI